MILLPFYCSLVLQCCRLLIASAWHSHWRRKKDLWLWSIPFVDVLQNKTTFKCPFRWLIIVTGRNHVLHLNSCFFFLKYWLLFGRSDFRIKNPKSPLFSQSCSPQVWGVISCMFCCSFSDAKHMERKWWETRLNSRGLSGRKTGRNAYRAHVGGLHTSHIWHCTV